MAPPLSLHCTLELIGPFSLAWGQRKPHVQAFDTNVLFPFNEVLWPMCLWLIFSPLHVTCVLNCSPGREYKVMICLLSSLWFTLAVNSHRRFQPFENLTWQKIDPFIFKAPTMIGTLISISMFDTIAFSLLFIILIQDDPDFSLRLLEIESRSWVVLQPKVPAYFRGKQANTLMGRPPSPPRELI